MTLFIRTIDGTMHAIGAGHTLYVFGQFVTLDDPNGEGFPVAGPFGTREEAEVALEEIIDAAYARARGERG